MNFLAFTFTLIISSLALGWLLYNVHTAMKKRPGRFAELFFAVVGLAAAGVLVYRNWAQLGSFFKSLRWEDVAEFVLAWDVLLFIALSSILTAATLEALNLSRKPKKIDPFRDRGDEEYKYRTYYVNLFNFAAVALKDTSSSYITAVSILISACFVIIQVSKSASQPGNGAAVAALAGVVAALPLVFRALVWFLFSLLFGVLALYRVFTHGRHEELSRSAPALVLLGLQLISLFTGLLQLAVGLYSVVFGG